MEKTLDRPRKVELKVEQDLNLAFPKNDSLFVSKTANQWIEESKNKPIPKMLFGEFWFESELCILFADTGQGKSILSVQIAESISRGTNISGFNLEANPQKVLYFDFELSDKQFENRYSQNYSNHYIFNENFVRCEIKPDCEIPEGVSFEKYLNYSITEEIKNTGSKVLVIDNITYLGTEMEKAKDALPLMKELISLKKKHNLSILVLAHTPKRDLSKAITRNDLQGSKMLMNFCDSSFAIGESHHDQSTKYFKQIKVRQMEFKYDSNNIAVCELSKPDNFLRFEFAGFGYERDHLREPSKEEIDSRKDLVSKLKSDGLSNDQIGKEIGISEGAVRKILKKIEAQK